MGLTDAIKHLLIAWCSVFAGNILATQSYAHIVCSKSTPWDVLLFKKNTEVNILTASSVLYLFFFHTISTQLDKTEILKSLYVLPLFYIPVCELYLFYLHVIHIFANCSALLYSLGQTVQSAV